MGVRASADYALTRHNVFGGVPFTRNNFRASVGVVIFTCELKTIPSREAIPASRLQLGNSEAALLGVSGYATDMGFKVTSVRPRSPAASIFLNPGDVISKMDNHDVLSSQDIETMIAGSQTGTVKVTCLIQTVVGVVSSKREAKVR